MIPAVGGRVDAQRQHPLADADQPGAVGEAHRQGLVLRRGDRQDVGRRRFDGHTAQRRPGAVRRHVHQMRRIAAEQFPPAVHVSQSGAARGNGAASDPHSRSAACDQATRSHRGRTPPTHQLPRDQITSPAGRGAPGLSYRRRGGRHNVSSSSACAGPGPAPLGPAPRSAAGPVRPAPGMVAARSAKPSASPEPGSASSSVVPSVATPSQAASSPARRLPPGHQPGEVRLRRHPRPSRVGALAAGPGSGRTPPPTPGTPARPGSPGCRGCAAGGRSAARPAAAWSRSAGQVADDLPGRHRLDQADQPLSCRSTRSPRRPAAARTGRSGRAPAPRAAAAGTR